MCDVFSRMRRVISFAFVSHARQDHSLELSGVCAWEHLDSVLVVSSLRSVCERVSECRPVPTRSWRLWIRHYRARQTDALAPRLSWWCECFETSLCGAPKAQR